MHAEYSDTFGPGAYATYSYNINLIDPEVGHILTGYILYWFSYQVVDDKKKSGSDIIIACGAINHVLIMIFSVASQTLFKTRKRKDTII